MVSPSRKDKQNFCSFPCYSHNQNKRNSADPKTNNNINVGGKYGFLTVCDINKSEILCKCNCGNLTMPKKYLVLRGLVKSCGCFNKIKNRRDGTESAWGQWFRYLKQAARTRNIYFYLTDEYIKNICTQNCSYCGVSPKKWEGSKKNYLSGCANKKTKTPDLIFAESKVLFLNGIDRIDSSLGYIVDNTQPCCTSCNLAKLNRSDKDFRLWIVMCYNNLTKENK